MNNQALRLQPEDAVSWSNRVLALAIAGILFLTLYPFRFSLHANPPLNRSPFLLVSGGKSTGPLNAFLNILMFVPFGFGLAQKLREKGKSGATILLLTIAGAFLSYCIELTQIYIPTRDSGWEDVFTNTTGAVVGYFLFELVGKPILKSTSEIENLFERFMTVAASALDHSSLFRNLFCRVCFITGGIAIIELDSRFTACGWKRCDGSSR